MTPRRLLLLSAILVVVCDLVVFVFLCVLIFTTWTPLPHVKHSNDNDGRVLGLFVLTVMTAVGPWLLFNWALTAARKETRNA